MNLKELEYMEEKVQKGRGMLARVKKLEERLAKLDIIYRIVMRDFHGDYLFEIGYGDDGMKEVIETIRKVTQDEIDSLKRIFAEL